MRRTITHRKRFSWHPAGLTLIEVMIATTLTLLIMLALAQGFKSLSDTVSAGRSRLALSDQLRGISTLLRSDLEGLTVDSSNPQSSLAGNGYFKYYDGPLSDSSATLFNYVPTGTSPPPPVEQLLGANRWGDIDDVLMFTSQAKSGEWFQGKMPLALLYINNLNQNIAVPLTSSAEWSVAWQTDVNIASRYAEIAWFMRPLDENGSIVIQELMGSGYSFIPPETSVVDVAPSVDLDGDGSPDPDGMPDRIALCRRVRLIRPDLDIRHTPRSNAAFVGLDDRQLTMRPLPLSETDVNSFRYSMRFAYQRCDLSVRPFYDEVTGLTLKTNTLSELQIPSNRFGHYVMPLSAFSAGPGTTLPLLALTSEPPPLLNSPLSNYRKLTDQCYGTLSPSAPLAAVNPLDRGFIPSCFFRTKISVSPSDMTRISEAIPTLEEVVASNVVAFDLKGYDLAVKQLASPGTDGKWGQAFVNDDDPNNLNASNPIDDEFEAGWPGTDDLTLTPADPGFSRALTNIAILPILVSNSGAFVDIDWSRKVIHARHRLASGSVQLGMSGVPALPAALTTIWASNLSGVEINSFGTIEPSSSFVKSGCVSIGGTSAFVYQPCFDTFTDAYESDGEYQQNVLGMFVAARDGLRRFGIASAAVAGIPDMGTDGLGNDDLEKETSPPIPYKLPSIQATIRVQDYTAGNLQQISIVHDMTNKQ